LSISFVPPLVDHLCIPYPSEARVGCSKVQLLISTVVCT
jgi:hypothetical protein